MRERLFRALGAIYRKPSGFAQSWQVFAMDGAASGHGMHRHGEAWLAQVAGRKVWWVAPPAASHGQEQVPSARPMFPYKALSAVEGGWPCAWLLQESLVPKVHGLVRRCVQNPGEVVVLPAGWWHATCSLDAFNVAVGGQADEQ